VAEDRTVGIDILDFKPEEDPEITLHIYDMAGQLEYQPYHQSFFSDRSINIVVWRINDLLDKGSIQCSQEVQSWLSSIYYTGLERRERWEKFCFEPENPIIILVGNRFEDGFGGAKKEWLAAGEAEVETKAQNFCKAKGLDLISCLKVDCKSGSGVVVLRKLLIQLIKTKAKIEIPKAIIDFEKYLELAYPPAQGIKVLSRQALHEIQQQAGILPNEEEGLVALRTFHNLGVFYWDQERDLVILNPRALPKVSGKLVQDFRGKAVDGFLKRQDLKFGEYAASISGLNPNINSNSSTSNRNNNNINILNNIRNNETDELLFQIFKDLGFFFQLAEDQFIVPFALRESPELPLALQKVEAGHCKSKFLCRTKDPNLTFPFGFIYNCAKGFKGIPGLEIDFIWQMGLGLRSRSAGRKSRLVISLGFSEDYLQIDCVGPADPAEKEAQERLIVMTLQQLSLLLKTACCFFTSCLSCEEIQEAENRDVPYFVPREVEIVAEGNKVVKVIKDFQPAERSNLENSIMDWTPSSSMMTNGSASSSSSSSSSISLPVNAATNFAPADQGFPSVHMPMQKPQPKPDECKLCGSSPIRISPHEFLVKSYCFKLSLEHTLHHSYRQIIFDVYRPRQGKPITLDVVFLHGLSGSPIKTWVCSENDQEVFWPSEWLASDFPRSRIVSVGYIANKFVWEIGNSYPLKNRASEILNALIDHGIGQDRSRGFILIGHSMGGLQIKEMLRICQTRKDEGAKMFFNNCRGIAFYGVPHLGTDLASYALNFSMFVPDIIKDLANHSNSLHSLNHDFLNLVATQKYLKQNVLNFVERQPVVMFTLALKVVPEWSATLDNFRNEFVEHDHHSICKPKNRNDPTYAVLKTKLKEWQEAI